MIQQVASLTLSAGLEESFTGASCGGQSASEADPTQGESVNPCRLEHQSANQVVDLQVEVDLSDDCRGLLAAQVFHLQGGLEVAQSSMGPSLKFQ